MGSNSWSAVYKHNIWTTELWRHSTKLIDVSNLTKLSTCDVMSVCLGCVRYLTCYYNYYLCNEYSTMSFTFGFILDFAPLGGRDWSFKKYIPCSNKSLEVNGTSKELIRSQFIPSCVNYDVKLEARENLNESLKFPGTCLKQVIDKFCTTQFLVPNILHYIWLGKGKFEFIFFVSIFSGYKKQHPCLIFLYYDTLPSGKWWNLLLLYVSNIIPVSVNPPSKIGNRKIVFVEHKSDILRLQILRGIYYCVTFSFWSEIGCSDDPFCRHYDIGYPLYVYTGISKLLENNIIKISLLSIEVKHSI